jgi:hypothetical protein
MVRGKVVMEHGNPVEDALGHGKFVSRPEKSASVE